MKANLTIQFCFTFGLLVAACDPATELTGGRKGGPGAGEAPGTGDGENPDGENPGDPAQCKSREYAGFGSLPLHANREVANIGVDRARLKPFSALSTEYTRVLGAAPASVQGAGPTFGQVPARWYEEPEANAVALQTAYTIAFDGCLTFTASAPDFAAAPDATSAPVQCSAMAKKFWSKTPAPQEIQACVDVAITGASSEANPRRKWAYACASVLSAAGFLTY